MPTSRLRISFRSTKGDTRSAILRGIDSERHPLVPDALQAFIHAGSWAGRTLTLDQLRQALGLLVGAKLLMSQNDAISWDSSDAHRLDIDIGIPLLLLARDLQILERDGSLEVGGA